MSTYIFSYNERECINMFGDLFTDVCKKETARTLKKTPCPEVEGDCLSEFCCKNE